MRMYTHRRRGPGAALAVPHRLTSLPFRLLQPIRHPHLAVHRRRGSYVLVRLLALAGAPVELTETEVAVGDERAHAELSGQHQSLTVGIFGSLGLRGTVTRCNLAEHLQQECAETPLSGVRDREGPLGERESLVAPVGQEIGLAQHGYPV